MKEKSRARSTKKKPSPTTTAWIQFRAWRGSWPWSETWNFVKSNCGLGKNTHCELSSHQFSRYVFCSLEIPAMSSEAISSEDVLIWKGRAANTFLALTLLEPCFWFILFMNTETKHANSSPCPPVLFIPITEPFPRVISVPAFLSASLWIGTYQSRGSASWCSALQSLR